MKLTLALILIGTLLVQTGCTEKVVYRHHTHSYSEAEPVRTGRSERRSEEAPATIPGAAMRLPDTAAPGSFRAEGSQ